MGQDIRPTQAQVGDLLQNNKFVFQVHRAPIFFYSVGDPLHSPGSVPNDPDPTPFFSDFKYVKKKIYIFSYNLPTGTPSSVLKIKFFAKNFC